MYTGILAILLLSLYCQNQIPFWSEIENTELFCHDFDYDGILLSRAYGTKAGLQFTILIIEGCFRFSKLTSYTDELQEEFV